jgi:hypothetical protein
MARVRVSTKLPRVRIGATLIAACAMSTPVWAAHKPETVPNRISGSSRVVVAHAKSVAPRWETNKWGDQLIVSRVVLEVEETLKGAPAKELAVDLDGGTLDGLTLRVSDLQSLEPGDRAVFFLDDTGGAALLPHLRGQGILELDNTDTVKGSSLHLDQIRGMARGQN